MPAYRDFQGVSLVDYLRDALLGLADVELFPPPPRLARVAERVRWGEDELPLLLLDDSGGDAERGFFFTSGALYVLHDGRRCPLALIQGGPHHPQGDEVVGFLQTTQGPFPVPALAAAHRRGSLRDTVAAVARYNRGERELSLESFAAQGPISALVVSHLLPFRQIRGAYRVSEHKLAGARRTYLMGLDHLAGERLLALADANLVDSGGETGMVLTDRRVLANLGGARVDIPYSAISAVDVTSGMLSSELVLGAWDRRISLDLGGLVESARGLHGFFLGLLGLVPHARFQEPSATNVEPRSTVQARNALLGATRKGRITEEAAADVRIRLDLVEQTLRFGRGAKDGWYESPLGHGDLRHALGVLFGTARPTAWDGRIETLDYPFRGRNQAHLPGVGVAWMIMPMSAPYPYLRTQLAALGGGTGFTLNGLRENAAIPLGSTMMQLNYRLAEIEQDILFRRILFGLEMDVRDLTVLPPHVVVARAAELSS